MKVFIYNISRNFAFFQYMDLLTDGGIVREVIKYCAIKYWRF